MDTVSRSEEPARWTVSFFFSSRRRHTRCSRDWSSDVCSSDLVVIAFDPGEFARGIGLFAHGLGDVLRASDALLLGCVVLQFRDGLFDLLLPQLSDRKSVV